MNLSKNNRYTTRGPVQNFHHRVLLIEDDPGIKLILSKIIESIEAPIQLSWLRTADDFFSLEPANRLSPFNLVLTDIYMPGLCTGYEIWTHFRESRSSTPVVMMSGLTRQEFLQNLAQPDAAPLYLPKPLDVEECRKTIATYLGILPEGNS